MDKKRFEKLYESMNQMNEILDGDLIAVKANPPKTDNKMTTEPRKISVFISL
ncbi:hypothetical protein [Legionella sp.]|uniref:hypothetical protein n=1 Tax=Legionella sp. TaxID=459 RepID=UPI0032204BEC